MIEEEIEIRGTDGTSDGVLFRPEGERRWPGVIFLTDIGGIRPATRDMARRLAAEGYCVLMPNVFYRSGRPPLWDFPRRLGEERTMKRIAELSAPVTPEAMERDASDYVEFCRPGLGRRGDDGALSVTASRAQWRCEPPPRIL